MSFLNPVNEPVLRFSSTDAGAPQINYNARVAGDIKTIIKACLVTGYGDKQSAGWSVINEVNHVAEFVSPSAAMSDYNLGIDDTSASSTTWYYQYQDARVNPIYNNPKKSLNYIDRASPNNGWQLFVSAQGVYFLEHAKSSFVSGHVSRLTFWGQIKSALIDVSGVNIGYWCLGIGAPSQYLDYTFSDTPSYTHYRLAGYGSLRFAGANVLGLSSNGFYNNSVIELTNPLFLYAGYSLVGQQPGLLVKDVNDIAKLSVIDDVVIDGRPLISFGLNIETGNTDTFKGRSRAMLIYLDYWEY